MSVITATSLSFPLSIPPRWAIKEMLRVFRALEFDDELWPTRSPVDRVETGVVELLLQNMAVNSRDVYGLTALALCKAGLLEKSESIAYSLYAVMPARKGRSVISESHRAFMVDSHIVDPVFKHMEIKGTTPERENVYTVTPYPLSVAKAVLMYIDPAKTVKPIGQVDDGDYSWFIQVTRRLARRQGLGPRWWSDKGQNAVKAKEGFIGYMRGMVPDFSRRSVSWRLHLLNSMMALFPGFGQDSAENFILLLEEEYGPREPRDRGHVQKLPHLVDPAVSFNFDGSNPIVQPNNDGLSGNPRDRSGY